MRAFPSVTSHRGLLSLLALALVGALFPADAAGLDLRRRYEDELVQWALRESALSVEPKPEGKRIERIVILRENIIADSDPWPNLFNIVHVKTREYVVRQELLVREGDLWDASAVEESVRNLRGMFILATARAVPCRSKTPGKLILLVVTKDIWSIRLNMAFSMTGQVVRVFDATPTEANFLGRNKRLSLHLRVSQFDFGDQGLRDHLMIGQRYTDFRVLGTRLSFAQSFDAIIEGQIPCGGRIGERTGVWCPSRSAGALGGVAAGVAVARPLYSLAAEWGFSASAGVSMYQRRAFRQSSAGGLALRTIQLSDEIEVPEVYDGQRLEGAMAFTRSFGTRLKHDLSWGLSVYDVRYTTPESSPFGRPIAELLHDFIFPRSEAASVFSVAYELRTTQFIRLRNVRGFALSEDYSIGPGFNVGVGLGQNLERSNQSFVTLSATAAYRFYFGGDLLHVSASAATRAQPRLDLAGYTAPFVNSSLSAGINNISPVLGIGRLHAQAVLTLAEENLSRGRQFLGGDSGLRGYPNDQFEGRNLLRVNVEYRSLPINLLTLHLGFVAFYDGGSVWGNPYPEGDDVPLASNEIPFAYRHSVGLGVRGHFPQFDRESLRIDIGFPLSAGRGDFGTWISLSFGQVF